MSEQPKKKNYWLHYFLPGLGLILLAFVTGSQPKMIFALFSFLAFFTAGVALMIEGRRAGEDEDDEEDWE